MDPVWGVEKGDYYTKDEVDFKIGDSSVRVPFMLVSTVDGDLRNSVRYLPLGTDSIVAYGVSEASFVIGHDLVVTGILWNSNYNTRKSVSDIALVKSVSGKATGSFGIRDSVNIAKKNSGEVLDWNVELSRGDLVAIKYIPIGGRSSERIRDLSVTLVGYYK